MSIYESFKQTTYSPVTAERLAAVVVHALGNTKGLSRLLAIGNFIRILDDQVDNGHNPEETEITLNQWTKHIQTMTDPDVKNIQLPENDSLSPLFVTAFIGLPANQHQQTLELTLQMMNSLKQDNHIIRTSQPLTTAQLYNRNMGMSHAALDGIALLGFERWPQRTNRSSRLCQNWIRYDAIRDRNEDLESGLILWSEGELARYNIHFNPDPAKQKIDNFAKFISESTKQTIHQILALLPAADDLAFPVSIQSSIKFYFLTRIIKLIASPGPNWSGRFKVNQTT
jgi:hypothetical protein